MSYLPGRTILPTRGLDVLRAMAVLFVLVDHVLTSQGWRLPLVSNWAIGRAGVLMFFVHTSLVLMASIERQGYRPDWMRAFYLRRAFRIYPLAIVTVIAAVIFAIPPHVTATSARETLPPHTPMILWGNLLLIQNLLGVRLLQGVLWSLPLEVQMYILLPACYLAARKGPLWALGLMGLGLVASYTVHHIDALWRFNLAFFAPVFLLGVLSFSLLRLYRVKDLPASPVTSVAHVIAQYSYGIYLFHVPALWLAFVVLRVSPIVQWTAFCCLVTWLPWLMYHLVEAPMISLGLRLSQPRLCAMPSIAPDASITL